MITRRRLLIAACTLALATLVVLSPLLVIRIDTSGHLSDDPTAVSHHQVAIVLGAGLDRNGQVSLFLKDRLDAAIALYRLGKVDGLLLTGDNHVSSYDEPPGDAGLRARSRGARRRHHAGLRRIRYL